MITPTPAHHRQTPLASPVPADAQADARDFAEFLSDQNALDVQAAHWQVRRQDGLAAGEEAEFQHWLAQSAEHQASFARIDGTWNRLGTLPSEKIARLRASVRSTDSTNSTDGLHGMASPLPRAIPPHTDHPARPAARGQRAFPFHLGRWVPQLAAACVTLAVVGGGGWLGWDRWQQQPIFTKTYSTARGQQLDVQLPDGSRLKLDTASRAEVTLYRKRREVRLPQGQALFSVQADAARPFDVWAGPLRIRVVGTRFSVRNTRAGLGLDGASVAVEEGRVRVAPAQTGADADEGALASHSNAVELTAGQFMEVDATGRWGKVTAQPTASAMLWREGRVNFERTPLAQALAEFERYGSTRLVINDPAVGALRVQGSFDLRQSGAFIKALPQVLPVRLVLRDGVTEVLAAP